MVRGSWPFYGPVAVFSGLLGSCGPASSRSNLVTVTWETPGDAAPRVGGMTVWGEALPRADEIWLVEGRIARTMAGELAAGQTPLGLQERRIPLWVRSQPGSLFLWPRVRLQASEVYSIVAIGAGVVASFQTSADELPFLSRLGSPNLRPGAWVSYCAESGAHLPEAFESGPIELPDAGRVELRLGLGASEIARDRCAEFQVPSRPGWVLPPARLWGAELDPEVLSLGAPEANEMEGTTASCVRADRAGRVEISAAADFSALRVIDAKGQMREAVALRGHASVGPLAELAEYNIEYVIGDESGRREGRERLSLGPGAPGFVINEVLADPKGAEPEGEWVELINVGNSAGSLSGYVLANERLEWALPDIALNPGAFGLIVRDDFRVEPDSDVVPRGDAARIAVPTLSLKNTGTQLTLFDSHHAVVSSFPALPGNSGVSVGRRDPYDDDPSAFGLHDAPGASPGANNELRPE
jgi:hypothetical protein